jgi:hypothetical protein
VIIPTYASLPFAFLGLIYFGQLVQSLGTFAYYKAQGIPIPATPEELTVSILAKENARLAEKINSLEQENTQITKLILQRIP